MYPSVLHSILVDLHSRVIHAHWHLYNDCIPFHNTTQLDGLDSAGKQHLMNMSTVFESLNI